MARDDLNTSIRLDPYYVDGIQFLTMARKADGEAASSRSAIVKEGLDLLFKEYGITRENVKEKLNRINEKYMKQLRAAKGWVIVSGNWYVDSNEYVCAMGGINDFTFFEESINNTDWRDYNFEFQVKPVAGSFAGVHFRVQETGTGGDFPEWNTGKFYQWSIGITADGCDGYSKLWKGMGTVGSEDSADIGGSTLKLNEWNDIKIEIAVEKVKLYLRGNLQKEFDLDTFEGDLYEYGGIGLSGYMVEARFANARLERNGFPAMAMKFAKKTAHK